jgi:predicted secreted acid phosphatase
MKKFVLLWAFSLTGIFGQELENLDIVKDRIAVYYEQGQYEAELKKVIDSAFVFVNTHHVQEKDAVVFDIDETALSNYSHIKEVGFGYIPSLWNDWIKEEKATRIEPVYKLYKAAVEKGFRIIFITGRNDSQYIPTYNNLLAQGYTTFDTLITKPMTHNYLSSAEYKADKRSALTARGYRFILCVGDQFSDCEISNYGIKIKLPNFLYFVK